MKARAHARAVACAWTRARRGRARLHLARHKLYLLKTMCFCGNRWQPFGNLSENCAFFCGNRWKPLIREKKA